MTEEQIKLVESYIKTNTPEDVEILNISTLVNPQKGTNLPKFLTHVQIEHKKTGLKANESFNSLKIYRELIKREKYNENN